MTEQRGAAITAADIRRMKDVEGLTWNQISASTGLTYNAVRNRYRRGRASAEKQHQSPTQQVTDNQDGNTREVESNGARITTLQQLIDYCKVDLSEWIIERHVVNKWEVGRKDVTKSLSFTDGTISGDIQDSGGINVEPLFQIKATLVKRHPDAIHPVIKPIHLTLQYTRQPQQMRGLRAALIVSDMQIGYSRNIHTGELTPFHDPQAMDVVAQIAQVIKPEMTVFVGDVIDFGGWSDKYIVRPEFYFTTQPALNAAAQYIGRLRELTTGRVIYIEGNHDQRPENQIIKHLVAAYGLRSADNLDAAPVLSIDNLLGLSRMGVEYIGGYPDGEVWLNDMTRVIHGDKVRGQPGQTAAAVVRDANETTIFGHIHRRELATKTIPFRGGYRTVTAFSPGCLCHVDGRVPGSKRTDQWQQGAAVVWYDEVISTIIPIDICNGTAVYNGTLYQSEPA
jgi:predicted phosphodiesterase